MVKRLLVIILIFMAFQMYGITPNKKPMQTVKTEADTISVMKGRKSMTINELEKLGIELPGSFFTILGDIDGLKDSTQVFVIDLNDGNCLAQTKAANGRFRLHGKVKHEGLCGLGFAGYSNRTSLFMANDSIWISGNMEHFDSFEMKGSAMVKDFEAYQSRFDQYNQKLAELNQRITIEKPGILRDSLINEYKKIVVVNADSFLNAKPDSPVGCYILFTISGIITQDELESYFNKLKPEAKKGYYAELLRRKINENKFNVVGTVAKDFTQNNPEGKPVSLHAMKGKYVLIHFWGSWSKECLDELPELVSVYEQYKDKNFTIVSVGLEMDAQSWTKAIKDNKLRWTHVSDLKLWKNEVAESYHIESIPQNILIDTEGKIVAKNLTMKEMVEKLPLLCK